MSKLIKKILRKNFVFFQSIGLNILPSHFYSGIPNISDLKKDGFWKKPLSMHAINMDSTEDQIQFVKKCMDEVNDLGVIYQKAIESSSEIGYGPIEAEFLHAFICKHQPKKIVQIGCGISTSVILKTYEKYPESSVELICVDPFPSPFLEQKHKEGKITLISEKAQKVDYDFLADLNDGDLLFIDTTHTVKIGSEVNYLILEVLPRLKKNVFVHFHDIYFPFEYPRNLLSDSLFFPNETSLLYSFLLGNSNFNIKACFSFLHYKASKSLKEVIHTYNPQTNDDGLSPKKESGKHFPSCIYLKTK